jgi:hypothetical protein
MPPWRSNPGSILPVALIALKDASISLISIHQASGKYEYKRTELSKIVNDVINSNPEENHRRDHLMAHLQNNVVGEVYFFEVPLERLINFDETRIGLDQTDAQ